MIVRLYTFNKRKNSTAVPTDGTVFTVSLKTDTDILSPRLDFAPTATPPTAYNYVYILDFSRYYFISKWEWSMGIWTAQCTVDVAASWKANILATTAFVLYSSSSYNLNALDERIAAIGTQNRNVATQTFVGASLAGSSQSPNGTFCLTALDDTGVWATGATTTYFMTYQQMQLFAQELINPSAWESLKQFWENPMDAIVDCYYLPMDISSYIDRTTERNVVIGSYTFPNTKARSALKTNLALEWQHTTIDIPWQYSDFRNLPPYTSLEMFVPFCGAKPLPTEALYGFDSILIDYGVDITTGLVQCIAYVKETLLQEWTGNIQVKLPVGQSQSRAEQVLGGIAGAAATVGGIVSKNAVVTVKGLSTAIGSVISQTDQKMLGGFSGSVLGSILGNNVGRWQKFILTCAYHDSLTDPANIRSSVGNICGAVRSLGSLTGYVQTADASVSAPATDTELEIINSMLDTGMFLE